MTPEHRLAAAVSVEDVRAIMQGLIRKATGGDEGRGGQNVRKIASMISLCRSLIFVAVLK